MTRKYSWFSPEYSYPQMNYLQSIGRFLVDTLLPKRCVGCKNIGADICSECATKLPSATQAKQDYISSLYDYRNPLVQRAIWRFKYGNARAIALFWGPLLYDEIIGDLGEQLTFSKQEKILLVPIPLHTHRLRERGYNQSELLTKSILAHDHDNLFALEPEALTRIRDTKSQAKSDARTARIKNLHGAFVADEQIVRGKNIILVDDVVTTGATIDEARKTLLASGARSVRAYTIAH